MKQKNKKIDKLLPAHNEGNIPDQERDEEENYAFPGHPHDTASDDIYNKEKKEDLNTIDLGKIKSNRDKKGK